MKISIKHLESLSASSLGYHSVAVDHNLSAIISIVSSSVAVFLLNINSVGIFHSAFWEPLKSVFFRCFSWPFLQFFNLSFLDTADCSLEDNLILCTNCQVAAENIPDVKAHYSCVISYMMVLACYKGLSGAGKGKLGLTLCCHFSPVPSVQYTTVLCADSVTQADK